MTSTAKWTATVTPALLLAAPCASAHHSPAHYDPQRSIVVEGVVKRYEWANPHVYIYVEQAAEGGEPVVWEVEGPWPTAMVHNGWSATTLAAGDRVEVEGRPARNRANRAMFGISVRKDNGPSLTIYGDSIARTAGEPPTTSRAEGLSGTWLPVQTDPTPFLPSPEARALWSLTEQGREALESFAESAESLDCISVATPFLMVWPDVKQIEVRDETVVIRAAIVGDVERSVELDVASRAGSKATNQGHSTGYFDGDALVVETAGFTPHSWGIGAGLPSSTQKRVRERFELSEDGSRLIYSYSVEDPVYLMAPFTGSAVWAYRPDLEYAGLPCDPDNARRYLEE